MTRSTMMSDHFELISSYNVYTEQLLFEIISELKENDLVEFIDEDIDKVVEMFRRKNGVTVSLVRHKTGNETLTQLYFYEPKFDDISLTLPILF